MIRIAPARSRKRPAPPAANALSISQLASRVAEPAHVVRYYCRIGLLQPRRGSNGYRRFDDRALARVRFIRQAQSLGFTLEEIATIFHHANAGRSPCPEVRRILEARVPQIGGQLDGLIEMHRRMSRALARWRRLPDQVPTGESVCALIESESESHLKRRSKP